MLETTDTTRQFSNTPEGKNIFTVKELPIKKPTSKGDKVFFQFKFTYVLAGEKKTHTEVLMPWNLPPLLKAFGFEETEKNKFVWDRQECIGKSVEAVIVHETDKKDPTKIYTRMTEIVKASEMSF